MSTSEHQSNAKVRRKLEGAIESGEVLTVVYHGGHAPGAKRRIVPRRINEGLLYAKDFGDTPLKTYKVDLIELSSDTAPAPWAHEVASKEKFQKVDPTEYFGDWQFEIHRSLWPALGVTLREYIDKERTAKAREEARQNGEDNLTRIAVRYLAHAVADTPKLDFHEGDLFTLKGDGNVMLQVIAQGEYIEAHCITLHSIPKRYAYQMTDTQLADWLRTGNEPKGARIGQGQSYSEVLRFSIEEPD